MDSIIWPIVLYGGEVWGPSLLESNWAKTKSVQTLMLWHIIKSKRTIPEFVARPFQIDPMFILVSFLHHIWRFVDWAASRDRYLYRNYCSSKAIASNSPTRWDYDCWFSKVSCHLRSMGISIDRLPPLWYSLDAPRHLLHNKQKLNEMIRGDIYK